MKNFGLYSKLGKIIGALCFTAVTVSATTYYVSPTGNNSAAGTKDLPFASLQKGNDVAVAGDTVYIRGGTYAITKGTNANSGILLSKSGTSDAKRICYWAYPGEKPKFDFTGMSVASSTSAGIYITGSWLHLKGLEVCNLYAGSTASNDGIWGNPTSNTIIELCDAHNIMGPGICVANGTGGNLILNCDSHDNYDPNSSKGAGQNADGFGCHYQKTGPSTIFRGCRAWWNSDDGYDCIAQGVAVIYENCWALKHGYFNQGSQKAAQGNGNGFKAGGWGNPPSGYPNPIPVHIVRNCVSLYNSAAGFYENHQPTSDSMYNNTAFNNGANYNMLGYDLATGNGSAGMGIYRNNISYGVTATSNATGTKFDAANNSWTVAGLSVAASDFESIDTAGIMGPRRADGSVPNTKFMRLSATSKLIDIGTKVGLPYSGKAPDFGAFEYGTTGVDQSQPIAQKTPSTLSLEKAQTNLQKIQLFDLSGRRLDNSAISHANRPFICKELQPGGHSQTYTIFNMR